jgi:hypothetical protein
MRRIRKPGIYPLSAAEYLADPCARPSLNRGTVQKLIEQSAAHAWMKHPRYGKRGEVADEDDMMAVGSAVHSAFLLGDDLVAEFPFDSWRSDSAKARRQQSIAAGRIPLLPPKALAVRGILQALYAFRQRTGAFTAGKPEQTIIWKVGAIYCRARVDWLHDDAAADLWDLKVTGGLALPDPWRARALEVGADIQAVMYPAGAAKVRGKQPRGMRFCVVEDKPPHGIRVFRFDSESLEIAQVKYDRAIEMWTTCQAENDWPNYPDEEVTLEPGFRQRRDWGDETATMRALRGGGNGQLQRAKDEAAVGEMVRQGQWGG